VKHLFLPLEGDFPLSSGGVTESWELGELANSSTTLDSTGTGMSFFSGVQEGSSSELVEAAVETGVTTEGPELCWSFCWAAFFFRLSLKHLEHIPSKLALPKKPHP